MLIPAHSEPGATLLKPIPLNYGITMVSEAIVGVKETWKHGKENSENPSVPNSCGFEEFLETWGGFGEILGTKNRCGPSDYLTISD